MVKKKNKTLNADIVRITQDAAQLDLTSLPTEQLVRRVQELEAQLNARQLDLTNLQISEARLNLLSRHRQLMVDKYVSEIAALDRVTPGGLRSVQPSEGDDPELVDEAWRIYVQMQRGGGSRFG
jgi:hypothetical protein